jgi:hypothetical protein
VRRLYTRRADVTVAVLFEMPPPRITGRRRMAVQHRCTHRHFWLGSGRYCRLHAVADPPVEPTVGRWLGSLGRAEDAAVLTVNLNRAGFA